jgi:segregation and condensation protein B
MSVKAKVEAIIYATEEPVTISQLASLLREPVLAELRAEEEARLVLNDMISDGKPAVSDDDSDYEAPTADTQQQLEQKANYFSGELLTADDLTEEQQAERTKDESKQIKAYLNRVLDELTAEYSAASHGVEVRQIAGGYRMGTKPEHHDVVVGFAKSLKPPVRLSLQALETLAVIAYKQPVTVPEISEIRGVDSSGVIATLLDRKLITTSGRKQVIGRPILYKTTKEFLLRFGLNNVAELPSMEEFEKLGDPQADLFTQPAAEPPTEATETSAETQEAPADPEAGPDVADATPAPENTA